VQSYVFIICVVVIISALQYGTTAQLIGSWTAFKDISGKIKNSSRNFLEYVIASPEYYTITASILNTYPWGRIPTRPQM
jgi:hypothetical protein